MRAGIVRFLLLVLMVMILSGCSKEQNDVWLTVGNESVYGPEVMLYLLQTFNEFEEYGGEDVWLIQDFSGGKSASEVAKQGAVDNIIKNKVLVQKAMESGIEVSQSDKKNLEDKAKVYFNQLPDTFVVSNNIDMTTVNRIFIDNFLADALTEHTMKDYSDPVEVKARLGNNEDYARLSVLAPVDVLTTFRVHHLVIRSHERDEDGVWQPLPEEVQIAVEQNINGIYESLLDGEDFVETVKSASASDYYVTQPDGLVLSRAQLPEAYLNAFEDLEEGQMTPVIMGEYGYHVFYLMEKKEPTSEALASYEERFFEWEASMTAEVESALIKEAFDLIYGRWRDGTSITYGKSWNTLDFLETIRNFAEIGSDQ